MLETVAAICTIIGTVSTIYGLWRGYLRGKNRAADLRWSVRRNQTQLRKLQLQVQALQSQVQALQLAGKAVEPPVDAGGKVEIPKPDLTEPVESDLPLRSQPVVEALLLIVGVGLILVGLFLLGLKALGDSGLDYVAGDKPDIKVNCAPRSGTCTSYWSWTFDASKRSIETTLKPERDLKEYDKLLGNLYGVGFECPAEMKWTINADGALVGSGVVRTTRDDNGDFKRLPKRVNSLQLRAQRVDRASCSSELRWFMPGLDAPGFMPVWPSL